MCKKPKHNNIIHTSKKASNLSQLRTKNSGIVACKMILKMYCKTQWTMFSMLSVCICRSKLQFVARGGFQSHPVVVFLGEMILLFVSLCPSPLRPEVLAARSGCRQGHVILRWSRLSLHHPGHQSPSRVRHTRGAEPPWETQRHEQSVLEAGICSYSYAIICLRHHYGIKKS